MTSAFSLTMSQYQCSLKSRPIFHNFALPKEMLQSPLISFGDRQLFLEIIGQSEKLGPNFSLGKSYVEWVDSTLFHY